MNNRRKILTLVGLVVFGLIIFFHYYSFDYPYLMSYPAIEDVRMPIFVLAVFYAGLFFLFGGKDAAPVPRRPRNWRLIVGVILAGLVVVGVILAGLVVVGVIAAIIYVQEQTATRQREIESEKREQAKKNEEEDSKHRIKSSEIDLIDLRLLDVSDTLLGRLRDYLLTGRIRNRSVHNCTLNSITLIVTLREKEGSPDILGEETVQIEVEVPPHQTREFMETINFKNSPKLTHYAWTHAITEIRGSKGSDLPTYDELTAPAVTPTPSPTP